jgi:hypothetical protein
MNSAFSSQPSLHQIEADQRVIITELTRLTGLPSRWSGKVVISHALNINGDPEYNGYKDWNCDIIIHHYRLVGDGRFNTGVHEGLHSISVGMNPLDYLAYSGFEEGVVEKLTRILRDEVFAGMGLQGPFEVRDGVYYEQFVILLEDLRFRTGKAEREFYIEMLRTPLRDREETVVQWIGVASPQKTRIQIAAEIDSIVYSGPVCQDTKRTFFKLDSSPFSGVVWAVSK